MNHNGISILSALVWMLFSCDGTHAHSQWGDGSTVPESIKKRCCSEAEAHLLPPGSVHATPDGWRIDGYSRIVPFGNELPSTDDEDWGFWTDYRYGHQQAIGGQSEIRCLFLRNRGY
jgi:hypothetical protein